MIKKIKMPKQAGWLIPGLQVKRWFALILAGAVLMTVGILILFDLQPIWNTMQFISKIATKIVGDELNGTEYPRNEYTF